MSKLAELALFALAVLPLAGCSAEVSTSTSVSRSELEDQVAETITPDDPEATVEAACEGDLDGLVDATRDCHVVIGKETADVRVQVTSVDGGDVEFDLTPFVPAERVAETIWAALVDEGFQIDSVECEGELVGVVDETVACAALPAGGDGALKATVTSVDGLLVHFDYEVVS